MSADRPHSKNIAKGISRKAYDAVQGKSGKQLSLPFDELEVPTMESAKRKLEASKAEGRKAVPGQGHGAKAVFGTAEGPVPKTKAMKVTPYASENTRKNSVTKGSAVPKADKASAKVSGGGARLQVPKTQPSVVPEVPARTSSRGATDSKILLVVPPVKGVDTGKGESASAPVKNTPPKSGAAGYLAKASKEFSAGVEVYGEASDGVDFRSRAGRSASIARETRGGGRGVVGPEQEARLAREAMLGTMKKQVATSRKKDVEPDLPLHAGPGPTMESRKKSSLSTPQKRGAVKNNAVAGYGGGSGGKAGKAGIRRIGGAGAGKGGGASIAGSHPRVNGMEAVVLVLVVLAVVLLITLVAVFVRTGRTAEKRVPVVAEGVASRTGSLDVVPADSLFDADIGGEASLVRPDNSLLVEIRAGMTARQACQVLEDHGVISDFQVLLDYLVAENLAGSIRQGSFLLKKGMDAASCASVITNRSSSVVDLTVFPGYTIAEIDRLLTLRGYAEAGDFIGATDALTKGYGLSFAEGWFLAGTYQVPRVDGAQALAMSMYQAMLGALQPLLGDIGVLDRSVDDVLIVASMVQRETNEAAEMPLIAGIIYKRLDEGIALGIDATTRYETGNWTDPIDPVDLETRTPYNTRRKKGLPPSGIGCVGLDALNAAVYPSKSDWYYYLHGTDGMIHFARTYEEHQQNITMWR